MFLIEKGKNRISKIAKGNFGEMGFTERYHLQEWIVNNPTFFGEDDELLFIQKEFDGFNDTRERLDLLALDKNGAIVVIENKLDDSGRDAMWQVLKYASYCASLTKEEIIKIYQEYLNKQSNGENAEINLTKFYEADDISEVSDLNKFQRIIMVSGDFRKEVTSTVLWLLNNYKLKIQCFRVTPYSMSDQLLLDVEKIIPVKEAEDYMIKMANKKQEENDTQEELKSRHRIRLEFWKKLLEKVNKSETKLFQKVSPSKENWIGGSTGMSGTGLYFVISGNTCRTELYLSRGLTEENKYIFDQLYVEREKIETEFDGKLIWERLDDKKACRIKHMLEDVSYFEKDDWDKMIDFMIDGMIRMEKALIRPLRAINIKLKKEGVV